MAQKIDPTDIDPQQMERAQAMWVNFMEVSKWSVISIAALLLILYLLFV